MLVMQYKAENEAGFGSYWVVLLPVDADVGAIPDEYKDRFGSLYPQYEIDVESDDILTPEEKNAILTDIKEKGFYLEERRMGLTFDSDDDDDAGDEDDDIDLEI